MIHYNDSDYIYHFGVPGMKWGIKKDKRALKKINKSMAKWEKAFVKSEQAKQIKKVPGFNNRSIVVYNKKLVDKANKAMSKTADLLDKFGKDRLIYNSKANRYSIK